jgi:hypothetical protein
MVGKTSNATVSRSGLPIFSNFIKRPSPIPRSRIRFASLGICSRSTALPSVQCGDGPPRSDMPEHVEQKTSPFQTEFPHS